MAAAPGEGPGAEGWADGAGSGSRGGAASAGSGPSADAAADGEGGAADAVGGGGTPAVGAAEAATASVLLGAILHGVFCLRNRWSCPSAWLSSNHDHLSLSPCQCFCMFMKVLLSSILPSTSY